MAVQMIFLPVIHSLCAMKVLGLIVENRLYVANENRRILENQ